MLTDNENGKRKCTGDTQDQQETCSKRQKPETDTEKKEEKNNIVNKQKQQQNQSSNQQQAQPNSQPLQNTHEEALINLLDEANDVYLFFEDTEDGWSDFKREQKIIDGLKDEVKKTERSSTEYAEIYMAFSQIYEYRYGQLVRGEYGAHVENEKELQEESKALCYQYLDEAKKYLMHVVAQENNEQLNLSLCKKFFDVRFSFYDSIYEYEDTNFRKKTVRAARAAVESFPNSFYFLQHLADVLAYEDPSKNDIRNEGELREAKQYYQIALQLDPSDRYVRNSIAEVDKRIIKLEALQQDEQQTACASSTLPTNPYRFAASWSPSGSSTSYTSARSSSFTSSVAPSIAAESSSFSAW